MRPSMFQKISFAAASLFCAAPAFAASQTQTSDFNFSMTRNPNEVDCYDGTDTKTFNLFDTQGGARTLDNVTLNLNMNISGGLLVDSLQPAVLPRQNDGNDGRNGEDGEAPIEIELSGTADAGPASAANPALTTHAVFNNVADDGQDRLVRIDEDGKGSHFTTANLASFTSGDSIDVDLSAIAMVVYNDVGQVGRAEQLTAAGDVTLTYGYSTSENPTPIVPTPAALGGGMMLLAGLMLRRRPERRW